MSLTLGDNFSYQASKPLDARLKYDTLANMKAVGDSTMYDGCLAYCVATDKTYQWKSTNTVDTDLGKWREFSSGGGGGHAIEDSEGTALTQRDTMQFGEGFNATDDSTNEKTVVEPNLMTAEDMDDVVTPLPSVQSKYHKYSTEEQIVGTWIDGSPIYQKTINFGTLPNADTKLVDMNISNIDRIISYSGLAVSSTGIMPIPNVATENQYEVNLWFTSTQIRIITAVDRSNFTAYITIQYTKTTD